MVYHNFGIRGRESPSWLLSSFIASNMAIRLESFPEHHNPIICYHFEARRYLRAHRQGENLWNRTVPAWWERESWTSYLPIRQIKPMCTWKGRKSFCGNTGDIPDQKSSYVRLEQILGFWPIQLNTASQSFDWINSFIRWSTLPDIPEDICYRAYSFVSGFKQPTLERCRRLLLPVGNLARTRTGWWFGETKRVAGRFPPGCLVRLALGLVLSCLC